MELPEARVPPEVFLDVLSPEVMSAEVSIVPIGSQPGFGYLRGLPGRVRGWLHLSLLPYML